MTECKTEYITKEQALEAIKGKMWPGELEAAIKAIPPVDVVEVTRCEDCVKNKKCMLYSDYRFPFFENDYCSYGWDGEECRWASSASLLIDSQGEDDI